MTTLSLNNSTLTPNLQAVFPSDFEDLFQHLEDKLNGKILTIMSYLFDEVYDLKNELKMLSDNYSRENSNCNKRKRNIRAMLKLKVEPGNRK